MFVDAAEPGGWPEPKPWYWKPNKNSLYLLTDKGLALTLILVELAKWSDSYLREVHPTIVNGKSMKLLRNDKAAFANALEKKYREKLATTLYCK